LSSNAVPDVRPDAADAAQHTSSSACSLDPAASFTGTMSMSESGGQTVVTRQIGVRDSDRIIQERVGDLNLCMVAEGVGDGRANDGPANWVSLAPHVIMEVSRNGRTQRLEIDRRGGGTRTVWRVGQTERVFDAAAGRWRDRLLAVLDSTWKISALRGEESSLGGEISSIRGQESSLRGEISSLQGEVSSMRGQQSTIRGEESSLQGQISSIQGHLSSLRGEISSEQGVISSLNASSYGADSGERAQIAGSIARHNAEIARIEREIADYGESARVATVEQQIRALDADGKVAVIENQIRAYDLDGKVAAIERKIKDLDVDGKVAAVERRITALDADRRARQLENQRDEQLKQLSAAVDAIR
jgi:predicted  nucleic acid-binding Zn-ribbon protein